MIEVKNFSGGLNLDDSLQSVPGNDYVYALNISHDAVEGSNDQSITPIIANRIGDATYVYPSGTCKCIGAYPNTLRNTVIQFLWNSDDYHLILEFNLTTRLHTKIFKNLTDSAGIDVLGFTQAGKILSINVFNREEGDLLFFLDSLGRPTGLDISLFKQGEYTPVTRAILDKGKKPPLSPPSVIYDNDTTRRSNNFRNKLFRFKYRWIYDDFEKSTFSPISIVPLPVSILSDAYTSVVTNNNVIRMVANTGDKNVKSVEIAMSYVEKTNDWSDFKSVQIIKKSDLGLTQTTTEDIGDTLTVEITTFNGQVSENTEINIYLTELPSTERLIATYTTVAGDTLNDVTTALNTSMIGLGVVTTSYSYTNSLVYFFNNTTYIFGRISIDAAYNDNDNLDFPFAFYNDSTYPAIDIEESIQLFDSVPPKANAQEMLNGNILAYIGITEGYDKNTIEDIEITVGTIAAGSNGGGSTFVALKTVISSSDPTVQIIRYTLAGIPATGTIFEVKVKRKSDHVVLTASTYTSIAGDTIYTVEAALATNNTLSPTVNIVYGFGNVFVHTSTNTYEPIVTTFYSDLIITPPTSATETNSIATFPWSEEVNLARAYFDEKGVTNGILYTDKVSFPAYAENGSQQVLLPFMNVKVNDVPPIWAYSMQWYLTKTGTTYIAWVTNSVNKDETAYIYFDVTNFTTNAKKKPTTATVLSYAFKDGDRMRIWRDTDTPGIVYNDTYDAAVEGLVVDPIINLVPKTGSFLKIKNIAPFTAGINSSKNYVILIYTPTQQSANSSNQVYYEFGQQYEILSPGLPSRRHSGMVADQVVGSTPAEFNFYEGDAYFRQRTIAVSEIGYSIYNAIDRNFVDNYISAVNSVDGRPSIIDTNARRAYYSTLIRHGEAYQANTNINGLNRFYSKNFDEYDYSFGDALRLVVKNRQLIVFQKYKIGSVPLFSSLGKDANGLQVVFQTDKLLNPIQYHAGDFGIGTCPESIASFNYAIYGGDNIKGIIWRFSTDGVTPLSILYKVNSWANENITQADDQKIYGAFDQRLNNYIIAQSTDDTVCVPVSVPDFDLPDGQNGIEYYFTTRVSGTQDFQLSNFVKPTWMNIAMSGNYIVFSGVAEWTEAGWEISFTITNPCGTADVGPLPFNVIEMTTGTIDLWGGTSTSIPSGWLLCDGTAVSRATYANLFAAIGILYGAGNGTTTFNIPNIGKRVVAGYDAGNADYNPTGKTAGNNTPTIGVANLPAHQHLLFANATGVDGVDPLSSNPTRSPATATTDVSNLSYTIVTSAATPDATIGKSSVIGSGTPMDMRNEYIVLPYKIKT